MAINRALSEKTARDIDQRVARVLRGLGNPEPPLCLEDVRELLHLDLEFYTADDPGVIREAIDRIRVAGIQVSKRPTIIYDAIKKFSLQALYLPDRKRILIDGSLPLLKHRWNEGHEIGHSIIPWHREMMLGDNAHTVSRDCREQVEAEANYAAGRLLFLRDRFIEEARSLEPSIETIRILGKRFGNTISTTLHRVVESGFDLPLVGMISQHPYWSQQEDEFDPLNPCRHFIQSPAFRLRFGKTKELDVFSKVARDCGAQRGGPLGYDVLVLHDDDGGRHDFLFETFYNRYEALTLGKYLRPARIAISASP